MAVTDGWTERTRGAVPATGAGARPGARSLKAALSEAGLGDGAPELRRRDVTAASEFRPRSIASSVDRTPAAVDRAPIVDRAPAPVDPVASRATLAAPSLAFFTEAAQAATKPAVQQTGVVSPPPWVRAARRGRWRARMLNTFGWAMTLVVAGSIIGVAGRYLAVPPLGLESVQQARQ